MNSMIVFCENGVFQPIIHFVLLHVASSVVNDLPFYHTAQVPYSFLQLRKNCEVISTFRLFLFWERRRENQTPDFSFQVTSASNRHWVWSSTARSTTVESIKTKTKLISYWPILDLPWSIRWHLLFVYYVLELVIPNQNYWLKGAAKKKFRLKGLPRLSTRNLLDIFVYLESFTSYLVLNSVVWLSDVETESDFTNRLPIRSLL